MNKELERTITDFLKNLVQNKRVFPLVFGKVNITVVLDRRIKGYGYIDNFDKEMEKVRILLGVKNTSREIILATFLHELGHIHNFLRIKRRTGVSGLRMYLMRTRNSLLYLPSLKLADELEAWKFAWRTLKELGMWNERILEYSFECLLSYVTELD